VSRLPIYPFDLMDASWIETEPLGREIAQLGSLSLTPPWPWGQWLYGRMLERVLPIVPGDIVECGVAKGGMTLFLGHVGQRHGRRVYALDSFVGLPEPNPRLDNPYFQEGDYSPREDKGSLVKRLHDAIRARRLQGTVEVVSGFFAETLGTLPKGPLSFVHIDADLYHSVHSCLEALWSRISPGGLLAIDDFFHHAQGPARAAGTFFRRSGERVLYHVVFPYSVVILKGESVQPARHRSLDGNYYSLDLLREDVFLRNAIQTSLETARSNANARIVCNADRLVRLLQPDVCEHSSDIYEYFRALEDYWDNMDAERTCPDDHLHI